MSTSTSMSAGRMPPRLHSQLPISSLDLAESLARIKFRGTEGLANKCPPQPSVRGIPGTLRQPRSNICPPPVSGCSSHLGPPYVGGLTAGGTFASGPAPLLALQWTPIHARPHGHETASTRVGHLRVVGNREVRLWGQSPEAKSSQRRWRQRVSNSSSGCPRQKQTRCWPSWNAMGFAWSRSDTKRLACTWPRVSTRRLVESPQCSAIRDRARRTSCPGSSRLVMKAWP